MLLELNVKDIALIRKAEVSPGEKFNIMTGETGAGKSVIIGSCLLCLGGKVKGDIIREGAENAYIELLFSVDDPEKKKRLENLGVSFDEDGLLCLSRKISPGRSISKINGETVSLSLLRSCADELIDIYGQNEYHTLYDTENHLRILDSYLGERVFPMKKACRESYRTYREALSYAKSFNLEEERRLSEIALLQFEIAEIENAHLREGEEEELEDFYKKLNHKRNIVEALDSAYEALREARIGNAIRDVSEAMRYDSSLKDVLSELTDAESILSDAENEISSYVSEMELSDEALSETEARLDLIRNLERKYGKTIPDIAAGKEKKEARLSELTEYEENKEKAEKALRLARADLDQKARALSETRKEGAVTLCERIREEMLDLSFASVKIELPFTEKEPGEDGLDEVCFYAALNPGETARPISEVASGGELSRLMLSIKTVLAGTDHVPTLIFDEIDTGISGRTAQKVAEKLAQIASCHQVICITHLPQIAAMADTHFVIEKNEEDGHNVTAIRKLPREEQVTELARLLGGAAITGAVLENAAEMKTLAEQYQENAI